MTGMSMDPSPYAGVALGDAVKAVASDFSRAAIDTPDLDARLLVCMAGRATHERLIAAPDQRLSAQQAILLVSLVERRLSGEPVARILGVKEFWGRDFHLGPETLVPRPDSETLIAGVLDLVKAKRLPPNPVIADLGTGSGCLLIALLAELPGAVGVGSDLAMNALYVASANAVFHHVSRRCLFIRGDFAAALSGPFDIIVTNPPYVVREQILMLQREVAVHEPAMALDGGEDGLDAFREISRQVAGCLRPNGLFLAEIGLGQQDEVAEILRRTGLEVNQSDGFLKDHTGRVRVVQAVNKSGPQS